MLFNSLEFLLFFPVVCIGYFTINGNKWRNLWLLAASYYFYMCWEPVYALLLLTSTAITYFSAFLIGKYEKRKKFFLGVSIVLNLIILFFFKYFNWAAEGVGMLMETFGVKMSVPHFNILLPVGISFYIFQALGYSIDVYRGNVKIEKNFFTYALFVSFFPQLVAGPIERSTNLLKQFYEKHEFDYEKVMSGIRLMVWGYFMKLVVADRCAIYVDAIFNNVNHHNGGSFLIASLMFPFQLYGDFAGYSLIAIGCAKILGFNLMNNFMRPYIFSVSIQDYWKRNHISLTTWFMDYVYYPMIGSSINIYWWCFCIFITFVISGFWHGANLTYVLSFAIFGLYLVVCILKDKPQKRFEKKHNLKKAEWWIWLNRIITFALVVFALIFFRANNIADAFKVVSKIFVDMRYPFMREADMFAAFVAVSILLVKEFIDEYNINFSISESRFWLIRHAYIIFMVICIILFGVLGAEQFIYFQF
ncbi:MAG: MBOAT family protein [Bacteroidales bacterium]|nr:MBOAT family protein [Bacteroidales bacterium]